MHTGDVQIHGQDGQLPQDALDEFLAPRTLRGRARAVDAVEQLGRRDRRQEDLSGVRKLALLGGRASLEGDQDAGVDQESQGLPSTRDGLA